MHIVVSIMEIQHCAVYTYTNSVTSPKSLVISRSVAKVRAYNFFRGYVISQGKHLFCYSSNYICNILWQLRFSICCTIAHSWIISHLSEKNRSNMCRLSRTKNCAKKPPQPWHENRDHSSLLLYCMKYAKCPRICMIY